MQPRDDAIRLLLSECRGKMSLDAIVKASLVPLVPGV